MTDWTPPEGAQAAHTIIACLEHHAVDGVVQISVLTLSKLSGVSRRHIHTIMLDLEQRGVLTVLTVGKANEASKYRLVHPELVPREITWSAERKEALRSWWPRSFGSDLLGPINALAGAPITIRMIEAMARKMGLRHDKELMGRNERAKRNPGPTRIGQAKPMGKDPPARVWGPHQTVFQTQPMVARCAFWNCRHKPQGRWCADHSEAMRRPADEIVAALELVA